MADPNTNLWGGIDPSYYDVDPWSDDPEYVGTTSTPPPSTGEEYDEYGPGPHEYDIGTSDVKDNGDGTVTVTNQDGSKSTYGQDANGNWVDQLGNALKGAIPGLISTGVNYAIGGAIGPKLQNYFSGGLIKDSTNYAKGAADIFKNMQAPDLSQYIPQLSRQQMVGMGPVASTTADLAQVQGFMTPASMSASLAQMQGQMQAVLANAATAVQQGTMSPEQYQVVRAVVQGEMTPAQAEAALQQDSLMRGVESDQATLQGARTALTQLADIAEGKGLTDADRAQFNALMNQSNANAAQQRQAAVQQLQSQGVGSSGAGLAAALTGGQQTANANAMAGANIASQAQQRALQAIQAGLSGNAALNQQMFSQQAQKAQAQDAVNQFNASAKNAVNLQNAANQQQANALNYQTQNQFALQNAAAENAANQFNAGQRQSSNLANFNMANQFALQNAANQQQANMANAGFQNQANALNFNTANQFALANQQAQNQAAMANAGFQNQANALNFNTANQFALANQQAKNQANMANTGYQNQAMLANFGMANQIGANNTNIANQQAMLPYTTAQQNWQNKLDLAKAGSGASLNTANLLGNMGVTQALGSTGLLNGYMQGNAAQPTSGGSNVNPGQSAGQAAGSSAGKVIGDAVGKAAGGWLVNTVGGWLGGLFSDEDLKTDKHELSDEEVDRMMAEMTGYKYRYRGDANNPEVAGVMAQDMEKGMPSSVVDTPAGKMVQKPEALSQALAVLANQHARIQKLEGKK